MLALRNMLSFNLQLHESGSESNVLVVGDLTGGSAPESDSGY